MYKNIKPVFYSKFTKSFSSSKTIGWPPLIICGPSGAGKTTLKDHLVKTYPNKFEFSVSYTTRKPRNNEKNGIDYFFVERETFEKEKANNKFIESNRVHDNYYGTHRDVVSSIVNSGKICILDIDVQGVRMALSNGLVVANRMFISTRTLDELRSRLEARGTDTKEAIDRRIANAAKEIELAHSLNLFHVFVTHMDRQEFLNDCTSIIEGWYPFIKKR